MKWTKEEIQFLIDNYGEHGRAYCAKTLNRTIASVKMKANKLNLKSNSIWTKEEEQFLIENYAERGPAYCSKKLNRTYESVRIKANKLNLKTGWSEQEIHFLINNYSNGPTYCAKTLNRTVNSVKMKARKLNLKCGWSEQETHFLVNNYADKGPAYCVKYLDRTYGSVQMKASSLNLQANTRYNSNIVYMVYFPDHFLYKVGITNNVERRIKEFGQPCVLLKTQECEPIEAAQLERTLLKSVILIDTGALNNGNSETFIQPSELIEKFLGF